MSSGVLHFTCPSCHASLTVAASMAGVKGPCPRCSAQIQAPSNPFPVMPPHPALAPPAKTNHGDAIRPEPRSRPRRDQRIEPRLSTEDESFRRRTITRRRGNRTHRLNRWFVPAVFCLLSGVIVYALLYHFAPDGPGRRLHEANRRPLPATGPSRNPTPEPAPPLPGPTSPSTTPLRPFEPNPLHPAATVRTFDESEGRAAIQALEAFLSTRSLEARLPLLDPAPEPASTTGSVLDAPFPEVSDILARPAFRHPVEGWNGWPFRVSLRGGEGSTADYLILVVCRSDNPPKIATGPFLDLVGGGLARYAAEPRNEVPATFQAIIEPMQRCFEETVPSPERKLTYKLSSCPGGLEIARAYANRNSRLAEQLDAPGSGIHYGARVRAVFTVGWNRREDPERPYLEMIDIKALEWTP